MARRFGQRQVEVEMQDHDDALVVRKAIERRHQDLSVQHDPCEIRIDDGVAVGSTCSSTTSRRRDVRAARLQARR